MIQPNITHLPCDLDQQRKRADASKDSVARAILWQRGKRSWLDRLLRRGTPSVDVNAESMRLCDGEDVFHSFRL